MTEILAAVYVKDFDRAKVTLMCGGGSGHEPAHAGFVGVWIGINFHAGRLNYIHRQRNIDRLAALTRSALPAKTFGLAAVCGNVFASPSSLQVRRGIDLISSEKG